MLSFRYITAPDRRPTLSFSIKHLARATAGNFAAAIFIMFSFSYAFAYLSKIEPSIFNYKLDCYVDIAVLLGYYTGTARAVKKIYYEETCQGRDRLEQQEPGKSGRISREPPIFWKAYVKDLPLMGAPIVASLFVHILSRQRIVDRGTVVLTCFVVGAIVFKLAIQEGTKHYVFKKRVRSVRTMCVLVGMPTVLIDTQTRIVIQGTNSTTTASLGALGMAFVEICLRAFKAVLVVWSIRRRRSKILPDQSSLVHPVVPHEGDRQVIKGTSSISLSMTQKSSSLAMTKDDFDLWCRQIHAFHTAELNADMYAEYIAIGCSASILFFCGNHPCYSLLTQPHESGEVDDVAARRTNQLYMLLFQVVVEFVVDYVSLVIEMMVGIEFTHIKKLGSFLAGLFMITAAMNTNISINMYLS
ncbi:hypothetical protein PF008_g20034 [Phytophthora fragariae]|uniref:Uncharacterized protein n=1 Tax=Phytophthora fragariae TaxID=53985 RepID=A0A6G0R0N8_9STRA|nr:hypothetical protein PF008_g20034 [Phytophthora fragariae]